MQNLATLENNAITLNSKKGLTFVTHNENPNINTNGSHLQGYIRLDYQRIVQMLGEPEESDGYKVDAEWAVQFDNGVIATLYNYKSGKNYNGASGLDVEDMKNWHIGGFSREAAFMLHNLFGEVQSEEY